MTTLGELVAAH